MPTPTPYLRRLTNAFRFDLGSPASGVNTNLLDGVVSSQLYSSQRSPGATLIDYITPSPQEQNLPKWTLLGVSFKASLFWTIAGGGFGKLGKIFGGLLLPQDAFETTGTNFSPWQNGILSLPDPTLQTSLWTPEDNEAPSQFPYFGVTPNSQTPLSSLQQIEGSLLLPQPIDITAGENVAIGIWMMPSLLGASSQVSAAYVHYISVAYASYVLTYKA